MPPKPTTIAVFRMETPESAAPLLKNAENNNEDRYQWRKDQRTDLKECQNAEEQNGDKQNYDSNIHMLKIPLSDIFLFFIIFVYVVFFPLTSFPSATAELYSFAANRSYDPQIT